MRWYPGQATNEVTERETRIRAVARKAAAEGMVLLENNGILPLKAGMKIALYGQGARYTIKGGTGSGDVNSRNTVTVDAGLREAGFRIVNDDYLDRFDEAYAKSLKEREAEVYRAAGNDRDPKKLYHANATIQTKLPELPILAEDAAEAEAVIYVISRISGEFADRHAEKGDYYLSDREKNDLEAISGFGKPVVVLLNVGGIVDLSFLEENRVDALLLMSQAGSEGGNALADVLSGRVNPSGRLTDTWALRYEDYPSAETFSHRNGNLEEEYYTDGIFVGYRYFDSFDVKPRYPFGYGLSYTSFGYEVTGAELKGTRVTVRVKVSNSGSAAGREVIQLYAACPSGRLITERKRLTAFGKTGLLQPGEEETLSLSFELDQLSVYHEGRSAWILQGGEYGIFAGENAQAVKPAVRLKLSETAVTEQLSAVCELKEALKEICPEKPDMDLVGIAFPVPEIDITAAAGAVTAKRREQATGYCPDPETVREAAEIAKKMTLRDKACLVVGARSALAGEIVGSQANKIPGAAGETVAFENYGIPAMVLADGPAGVRVNREYEIDSATGSIIQPKDWFEMLEIRFFGKKIRHEEAELRYQFATAIPIGTMLAQAFDPELVQEVGEAVAEELRAFRIAVWLAPGMNIHRNPLCGRNFEYYSEDPLVSGVTAAAMTRGVQKEPGVGVSIKHFACNNQEDNRMHVNEHITERTLREIYLKGFEIAVKESPLKYIMSSYNLVNGTQTSENKDLLTEILRNEWGFKGMVMTDWGNNSQPYKEVLAGNNTKMPLGSNDNILAALCRGDITREDLKRNAAKVMECILL